MGTIGDCYDNAPMESFWGTMQIELLNREKWRTKIELSIAIADYIEHFYNAERRTVRSTTSRPIEFQDLQSKETQTELAISVVRRKRGEGNEAPPTGFEPVPPP